MAQNETAKATIYLDGKQAEAAIDALKKKSKELKVQLDEARKAGDNVTMKKLEGEIRSVDAASRSLLKDSFDVEKVLKNINKVSWRDLEKAQKAVVSEMKRMERGTEAYAAKEKDLRKITEELNRTRGVMKQSEGFWGNLANGANKYFGIITAAAASFAGVVLGLKQVVQAANDYEERVSNLSAITGLTGDNLDWLSQKAKEMSTSTLEGGIRITKSAKDIVDAFTKMGSARPELLKNKEALAQVTEQALILAEASKIDMQEAIDAVAASMNQFNLDASQSNRIINAIAAGSLEGSAEVADLTASMKNVGTVANDSNLSLEQTVAILEVLGAKQLKGEEAGTKLRGALLKMKDAGVGYASGQFNVRDAIIEVNANLAKHTSALEQDAIKQKVFGIENVTAGTILLQNIDKYDKLTAAVTGTNVATTQAITNTDNNNAKLAQARNRIDVISIALGEKLAPAMTAVTGWFGKSLVVLSYLVDVFSKYGVAIIGATLAITAYASAKKIASYWDTIHYAYLKTVTALEAAYATVKAVVTGQLKLATVAQKAWNVAVASNPLGAILAVIIAVGAAIWQYTKSVNAATASQKALNNIRAEAAKSIVEEKIQVQSLLDVARNEKLSKEERLAAIKKLNEISPKYMGALTLEEINTKKATEAAKEYIAELERKARLEAAYAALKDLDQKRIEDKASGKMFETSAWQETKVAARGFLLPGRMNKLRAEYRRENAMSYKSEYEAQRKTILEEIKNNTVNPVVETPGGNGNPGGSGGTGSSESDIALKALDLAHANEILRIKKFYADKEQLDKESKARLLAAELAYLQAKAQLETDPLKKVDLQSQIIDKQREYTVALKEAAPEIMKSREEIDKFNKRLLEESKLLGLAAKKQSDGAAAQEEYNAKQQQQADTIKMVGDVMTDYISGALNGSLDEYQTFGDTLILMSLQILKQMVPIFTAEILGYSLASNPGPIGLIKFAAMSGLLYAAVAAAEGAVKSGINKRREAATGSKQSGGYAETDPSDSTPAGIYHANEFIASANAVRNPTVKPILDVIDMAQRSGTIRSLNLSAMIPAGKQSGGFENTSNNSNNDAAFAFGLGLAPDDARSLTYAITRLNSHLDAGIRANINKYGVNGLDEALGDIETFKSKISRND